MAWLTSILAALLLFAAPTAAGAAECPERFKIVFADGARSCLTDHALAHDDVVGQFGADVRRLVPSNTTYALAATPALAQCRRAVGLGVPLNSNASVADTAARSEKALQDCRLRTRGATDECRCRVVLVDGRSPLTREEFARYADAPPAAAAAAAGAAGATAASSPRPSSAPSATPAPATAGAAAALPAQGAASVAGMVPPVAAAGTRPPGVAPSPDELAALRREIDSLRAEMTRPRPATEGGTAAPARPAQRARALVIGNSRYQQLGTLANPKRDAEAIAAKLQSFGIAVDLHLDVDRQRLVRALAAFQAGAAGYDINLLFYAGHGLQVGGINYIVPVDMQTEGATVGTVKLNGVSLDDALDYLPAPTRVVFLDACRDNPIARSLRSTRSGTGTGLAPVSSVSGTLLSYATRDGATAEDGAGGNSPYTTALLQHLDREEDIALVLRRVRQAVLQATSQRQEPWEYGSLVGEQLVLSRLGR